MRTTDQELYTALRIIQDTCNEHPDTCASCPLRYREYPSGGDRCAIITTAEPPCDWALIDPGKPWQAFPDE